MKEGYKKNMNKISVNICESLYDNVVAGDVLKVYRSINNFNIAPKEIIEVENNLMINSFFRTITLFNKKYLYYNLSVFLNDMGIFLNKEQIENDFIYLLYQSKKYIGNNSGYSSKIDYLDNFYKNLIDKSVEAQDVFKVHQGINLNNETFSEMISLERQIMIDSIQKYPGIYANKLAYYKLAMQIKGLGLKLRDLKQAEEIFNKLTLYTNNILDIPNLDSYIKLNVLDFLYKDLLNGPYSCNMFYENLIDKPVESQDVFKVHQRINLNNEAFSEMISLERQIMINSIQRYPSIYANKLAYYKLAMQIKDFGLKLKDLKQAEKIFNKLTLYTSNILDIPNLDSHTKLNVLDFLYFRCALDFDSNKSFSHQLSIVDKEIKTFLKQALKDAEDKKEGKKLVFSLGQKICVV